MRSADRILVAIARRYDIPLVSCDEKILAYPMSELFGKAIGFSIVNRGKGRSGFGRGDVESKL